MSQSIQDQLNEKIRHILDVFDQARENLSGVEVDVVIPKIVAIGDQSSGKSSVLESISRVVLPKKNEICTRAPVVMQLRNRTNTIDCQADYATIRPQSTPANQAKTINDFAEIEAEISRVQDELVQRHRAAIVDEPIHLTIHREGSVDLTLIDLPGMAYSLEENDLTRLKQMWDRYIEDENTIILYVVSAQTNLDTGEAYRFCRRVDERAERTLHIATKIDLSPDNFATQIPIVDIGLGYVCVRNRTDNEVSDGVEHDAILQVEKSLFDTLPQLRSVKMSSRGCPALINKLVSKQREMVLNCKSQFRDSLESALLQQKAIIDRLPEDIKDDHHRQKIFKEMTNALQRDMDDISAGIYHNVAPTSADRELRVRARLDELLKKHCTETRTRFRQFYSAEFVNGLAALVKNDHGVHLPNFLDYTIAYKFIELEWDNLQESCIALLAEVVDKCSHVADHLVEKHFARFNGVIRIVKDFATFRYKRVLDGTKEELLEMIAAEKSATYLSQTSQCEYERYLGILMKSQLTNDERVETFMGDCQMTLASQPSLQRKVSQIRASIHAYWLVALNRFTDQFHMLILQNFIMEFKTEFFNELDIEYSPNSGSEAGEDVRDKICDTARNISQRKSANFAIEKIEFSLQALRAVD